MRCNVMLNDGSYVNVAADHMEVKENMLYVWNGPQLQALADVSAIIEAHLSDKGAQMIDKSKAI